MPDATSSTPRTNDAATPVAPHQLANELTDDQRVVATDALPQTIAHTPSVASDRSARQVGKTVALIVLAAVAIGLMVAALLFQNLLLIGVGVVFIIPFILLVSAPVWLASTTKQAQDQSVIEQREGSH